MGDDDIFVNVRHDGKIGEVHLTDQQVIFQEKTKSLRSSRSQWPLEAVKEHAIKPVTCTVEVMLESDDFKEWISFQLPTLQEAMRFRKQLANRFHDGKSSVVSVSKDGSTKYLKEKVKKEDKQTKKDKGKKPTRPSIEVDVDDLIEAQASQNNSVATGSEDAKSTTVQVTKEAGELARVAAKATSPEDGISSGSCSSAARRRRTVKLTQSKSAQPKSLILQNIMEPGHLVGLDDSLEGAIETSPEDSSHGRGRTRDSHRTVGGESLMSTHQPTVSTISGNSASSSHGLSRESRERRSMQQALTLAMTCTEEGATKSMTDEEAAKKIRAAIQMQNDFLAKQGLRPAAGSERNEERKVDDSRTRDLEAGGEATPEAEHRFPGHQQNLLNAVNMVEARVVEETSAEYQGPSAIASEINVEEEQHKEPRRKLMPFAMVGGCIILVVVAVVAILFATNVFGGDEEAAAPVTVSTEERSAMVREGIQNVVYDEGSFQDPSSPQSKAFHWLTTEDTFHQGLVKIDDSLQEKLEQRYTLAVKRWEFCRPPETGEEAACIHPVLESYSNEGVFYDQKMSEPAFRWLSEVDECRWAGVKCTDGVHVSKLQLAGYRLQSTLPIELGFLRSLQILDLQQNSIFGSLPPEWGELESENTVLQNIRLDQNQLTGPIPEEWCQLNKSSMKSLVLSNNRLTGTIPTCLAKFSSLENLSVMNNLLTGTVPTNLGILISLQSFHVAGNDLTGSIPAEVCNLERYQMTEASADCNDALSENYVECPCCSTCCDGGDKDGCNLMHSMTGP